MADVASASAGLVQALKGNDAENLLTAIQAGLIFQDKPGDDRQRLRGKFYFVKSKTQPSFESLLLHKHLNSLWVHLDSCFSRAVSPYVQARRCDIQVLLW